MLAAAVYGVGNSVGHTSWKHLQGQKPDPCRDHVGFLTLFSLATIFLFCISPFVCVKAFFQGASFSISKEWYNMEAEAPRLYPKFI